MLHKATPVSPALSVWVDLRARNIVLPQTSPAATQAQVQHKTEHLTLTYDPTRIDCHIADYSITLCCGTPRKADGTPIGAGTIAQAAGRTDEGIWSELRGHFAVAHIDIRLGTVTLANDRFGIYPLAWSWRHGTLWVSDRADTVAAGCAAPVRVQSIYDYVYFHVIPAPHTIYEGVHRLEPSQKLTVDTHGARSTPIWSIAFTDHTEQSLPQLEQRFRAILAQSIEHELLPDGIGAFLSGGTDSSTVAGMIGKVSGKNAATFSIGFEQEGYDEMAYAQMAAKHFGSEHHAYYVTPADLLKNIPLVAAHYDQPFGNSSVVAAYSCAQHAHAHGVKKLLAGDGGDELFGGNTRYAKQKIFDVYQRVPDALRQQVVEPLLCDHPLARQLPLVRKLASYVTQARIPMPDRLETYNLLARYGADNLFTPALLSQVNAQLPLALQQQVYQRAPDTALVNRMLAYDWRFTLSDTDLVKVTGSTALAGICTGFPLLSDALVDFSLALPAEMKVRGLRLRWFFKHALRDFLPKEILRKKKQGFGLPFGPWLTRYPELRRFAREALESLANRHVIRTALVDDLFSNRLSEHAGYYGELVWILMMLEHWLATHVPGYRLGTGPSVLPTLR